MESISGDEFELSDGQESTVQDEKIFVAVRLRPLNEKEIAKNDVSDWECINNTTIVFKNNQAERPTYPNLYTFDRVYGCDTSTKQVYEEGVKGIALSVLNGINSTIFAYGQTSSGKTYTMYGITEYTIADIYDYISKQNDKEFVLKFSAIEIYNECVKDLLSQDSAPLRLLDDPEKGTVVEKLTEANLRDHNHLKELIYLCEAERQIGETALNEMSSRSHQILRLTVESSAREYKGGDNGRTLAATVNFVDLAGSERASQTLTAGTRLKEGCHINRSLLTLGTVVRKLSKRGGGHIPYRNSKLTRILQNSLGGNARTAILCTMCPAHSHVEQSRNTLLFASCAKDVTTNAQVNVVTSDKALVKQLQQELARLENELRMSPASNESAVIIRDMELQMEKMEKELEELTQQRDLAQSRLEHLIHLTGIDQKSLPWEEHDHLYEKGENQEVDPRFGASLNNYRLKNKEDSKISLMGHHFLDENSPRKFLDQYSMPDTYQEPKKFSQASITNQEDQNIERTSSIDDEIMIDPKESYKEDQRIEKMSNIEDNKDNRIIEKTSRIENKITINQEDRNKENQRIEETSSISNDIMRHPEKNYNKDQVIEKTSNMDVNTTRYPEASYNEDEVIEKRSNINDNITGYQDGNYNEDQVIEKTSNIDDNITRYPKANCDEDKVMEKTSNIDYNLKVSPEDQNEDRHIDKTSRIDDNNIINDRHNPKEKIEGIQKTIDPMKPNHEEPSPCSSDIDISDSEDNGFTRSKSGKEFTTTSSSPPSEKETMIEITNDNEFKGEFSGEQTIPKSKSEIDVNSSKQDSDSSVENEDFNEKKMGKWNKSPTEGDVNSDHSSTTKSLNELMTLDSEVGSSDKTEKEIEPKANESTQIIVDPNKNWSKVFEKQRSDIIKLWDECNTPLIHRTYFFLLFNGDHSDSVYMEVELRRLSFLKKTPSRAISAKALSRERISLSKMLLKKFSSTQRDTLFRKWGILLDSKHRRVQLCRLIWTKTDDLDHIKDSAELVAQVVGIVELNHTPKELFGLSFLPKPTIYKTSFWKANMSFG